MLDISCNDQFPPGFGRQPWLINPINGTAEEKEPACTFINPINGTAEKKEPACTFINPINGTAKERTIPEMKGKKCFGCFGEWVILVDELTRECFFLSLISSSKVHLPPFLQTQALEECAGKFSLTSSPTSPNCIITFVPFEKDFILLSRRHDKEWTKLAITHCISNNKVSPITGENIIYKGRLFILSSGSVALVFDVAALVDGHIMETMSYPFHDYPFSTPKRDNYFVESCEGLYLVRVHLFDEVQHVTHIEVYRLREPSEEKDQNQDEISWDYVSSIDDQAFFLSRMHGVSVCTKEFGVEPNCIYLATPCSDGERLYKYSLVDKTFSFNELLPGDEWNFGENLFWTTVPASGMQDIELGTVPPDVVELNKDIAISDEKPESNQISRPWADLPTELVESLFQRLSLVDCVRVSTVCKTWSLTSQFIPKEIAWPWLMHSPDIDDGKCKFFDPIRGTEHTQKIEALSETNQLVFHASRDGWVIISEGEAIFILNPLTEEMMDLPDLYVDKYNCISFTGMPTTPDCRVFAFYFRADDKKVKIYSWRPGQEKWTKTVPHIDTPFSGTINNPVLFDGEFYLLDRRGQLGVFNPDNMKWRVLSQPEPLYKGQVPHHAHACFSLLEVEGDLVAVISKDDTHANQVFRLDRSKMAWRKVEDLGDFTLFVGLRNSIAVPSPLKSRRNRIYLPKFDRDHTNGVFYSMDDSRYHPEFYGVKEPTTYVWFQRQMSTVRKKGDGCSVNSAEHMEQPSHQD
ncbi:hypothetical protein LUZ61_006253 [Rhynchospora tenuis]|uniref:F-box domain-containing protein n=1 Tax=Rhynchospora tenuis TaxID=198213 RepID=A0AAD5ZR96_9POAL|nr:hypothetical protein LUZ61_006253 [Rhynchospora tenuis]